MPAPKPAAKKGDLGNEQILYVKTSPRSPERVLGSFPLDADSILIDAAKIHEINRCRAAGLDVNALVFRVDREEI